MATADKSSRFTQPGEELFGPPLIGALLRAPWEAVRRRMLERMRENGFDDLDAAHLNVLLYPGPRERGPLNWPPGCGSASRRSTTCSGISSAPAISCAQPDPGRRALKADRAHAARRVAGPDDPGCRHGDRRRMGARSSGRSSANCSASSATQLLRELDAERSTPELASWRHGASNGPSRARTDDLLAASQTLSQLSYGPDDSPVSLAAELVTLGEVDLRMLVVARRSEPKVDGSLPLEHPRAEAGSTGRAPRNRRRRRRSHRPCTA